MRRALLLVWCAGCIASLGRGDGPRATPDGSPPPPAPAESRMRYDDGWITADQIRTLVGKPIAEAKRLLLSWGQTGGIFVSEDVYAGCGVGVVCGVNGITGAVMDQLVAKTDPGDQIILGTNKAAAITAPPE